MVEYVYRIQWGMLVCIQGTVGDAGVYTRHSGGIVVVYIWYSGGMVVVCIGYSGAWW